MDPKRIVALVVGAAVMVLIFSALLVPIINDATTTEKTFDNKPGSLYSVVELDEDSTYTMVYEANATTLTVNGESVNRVSGTIICQSSEFLIRDRGTSIQYVGPSTNITLGSDTIGFTITIEAGTMTIARTTGSPIEDISITSGYAIAKDGPFVMKAPQQNAYVLNSDEIYAFGVSTIGENWRNLFEITGTVEAVEVANIADPVAYTADNVVINSEAVTNYNELNTISSITFDATSVEDPTSVTPLTYSYFIVPAEVTAELSVHPDSATNALLSAIPIIAMIGIVLAVVGVAIVGRNDY